MPATPNLQLEYCKAYLRRVYASNTTALAALATTVAADAQAAVEVVQVGMEGGSGMGVLKFDRTILGLAIEEVLIELGAVTQPTGNAYDIPDWSGWASGSA